MTIHDPQTVLEALKTGQLESLSIPLVYQYTDMSGKTAFALFTAPAFDDMHASSYVKDVVCLMANGIRTKEGNSFVEHVEKVVSNG